jgi:hypothetical protein
MGCAVIGCRSLVVGDRAGGGVPDAGSRSADGVWYELICRRQPPALDIRKCLISLPPPPSSNLRREVAAMRNYEPAAEVKIAILTPLRQREIMRIPLPVRRLLETAS